MFNKNWWFLNFQKEFLNFSFCIHKLAVAFYMINEIQPKIKFQNIVQCPFNYTWVCFKWPKMWIKRLHVKIHNIITIYIYYKTIYFKGETWNLENTLTGALTQLQSNGFIIPLNQCFGLLLVSQGQNNYVSVTQGQACFGFEGKVSHYSANSIFL